MKNVMIMTLILVLSVASCEQLFDLGYGGITDQDPTTTNPIPRDGLVAEYLFKGNAHDSSGNKYHGTIDGATKTTDRFGKTKKAYYFDGLTNKIELSNNQIIPTGSSSFSVSLWIKPENIDVSSPGATIIQLKQDTQFYLALYENLIITGFRNSGGINVDKTYNDIKNNWVHIVSIFKGGLKSDIDNYDIYLNGIIMTQGKASNAGGSGCGTLNVLGYDSWSGTANLKGAIDDVRIYNRVLTETEITQLYTEQNYASHSILAGLQAYWSFDTGPDDDTMNNNNGTAVGGVSHITTGQKVGSGAYSFNGDGYINMGNIFGYERTDAFTYSFWAKSAGQNDTYAFVINKMQGSGPYWRGYALEINDRGDAIRFQSDYEPNWPNSNAIIGSSGHGCYPINKWNHFVWTYDGSSSASGVFLYINGERFSLNVQVDALTGTLLNSESLFIGNDTRSFGFNGIIDEVGAWNRALIQEEVGYLYNSGAGKNPLK